MHISLRQKPRLIICDNDGVCNDIERARNGYWPLAASAHGFPNYSAEQFQVTLGRSSPEVLQEVRRLVVPHLEESVGLAQAASIKKTRDSYVDRHLATFGVPTRDGHHEFIGTLDQLSVPKLVATASNAATALKLLDGLDLRRRFLTVITSDQVKCGKRDPNFFHQVREEAGTLCRTEFAPEDCLSIEDSNFAAEGALESGIPLLVVRGLEEPSEAVKRGAAQVVSTLWQASRWLRAVFGLESRPPSPDESAEEPAVRLASPAELGA